MGTEIEKKFLVAAMPADLMAAASQTDIRQGYLAMTEDREIRVRAKGDGFFMTVKDGSGLVRGETEIAISADQFDALWPLTEAARIEKTRYKLEQDGDILEFDIFRGTLDGLVMMEVEFDDVATAEAWPVPGYVQADVTNDKRYKNVQLALKGRPA